MRILMIILRNNALTTATSVNQDYEYSGKMARTIMTSVIEMEAMPKEGEFFYIPHHGLPYICLNIEKSTEFIPKEFNGVVVVDTFRSKKN